MNTQTHLLLACAVLLPATSHYRSAIENETSNLTKPSLWLLSITAVSGALLPDASLFVMWGVAKSQGVAESIIWGDLYYSPFWQQMGAITNSLPLYLLIVLLSWWAGAHLPGITNKYVPVASEKLSGEGSLADLALVFAAAAMLHVVTDFPLHHDDGHPHFWPFTRWIFASPLSYWDPAHYGRIWSMIEVLIALLLIVVLWRRYRSRLIKALLLLVGLSYFAVAAYWMYSIPF